MTMPCAKRILQAGVAGYILGASLTAVAAPSFRADKNYPNLGLCVRVLGNSEPEPLPQCKQYTYTFTRGPESFTRDMFDPYELWYATQHAGQWRDKDGNTLIFGRATHLLPSFADKHVQREDFDKAMLDPANAMDPSSTNALTAWVKAFADSAPLGVEPLRAQSINLAGAIFFPVKEPSLMVYAFRVKMRKPNGKTAPSDWFCALVKIADGTPKAKVRKDFETQLLANVAAMPQTGTGSTGGVQAKALTVGPAGGRAASAAAIPDHPSRIAARKSIANMKNWWYAETPDYIFLSDIRSAAGRKLVKDLQATMPVLRGAFAQIIPPFTNSTDVSVVRIYEEAEAYKQYVGKGAEWSVGIWSPMRRELVIQAQGKGKEDTLEIIKHEGFHQYLFYACGMIETSAWFNEGHACFFEVADVPRQGGRVEIPESPRMAYLLDHLDAASSLIPQLIHFGYDEFYKGTDQRRQLNYATSWGLIYFLRKGLHSEKYSAYAPVLGTYLATLASTQDAEKASAAAFAGVDMARFQADFSDFWKRGRNSARHSNPFAEKAGKSDRKPSLEPARTHPSS